MLDSGVFGDSHESYPSSGSGALLAFGESGKRNGEAFAWRVGEVPFGLDCAGGAAPAVWRIEDDDHRFAVVEVLSGDVGDLTPKADLVRACAERWAGGSGSSESTTEVAL